MRAASCFDYTLSGSSGGNEVRIAFAPERGHRGQGLALCLSIPPFANGKSGTVCVKVVSCQSLAELHRLQHTLRAANRSHGRQRGWRVRLVPDQARAVAKGTSTLSQICGAKARPSSPKTSARESSPSSNVELGSDTACTTPALKSAAASLTFDSDMFQTGAHPERLPIERRRLALVASPATARCQAKWRARRRQFERQLRR